MGKAAVTDMVFAIIVMLILIGMRMRVAREIDEIRKEVEEIKNRLM